MSNDRVRAIDLVPRRVEGEAETYEFSVPPGSAVLRDIYYCADAAVTTSELRTHDYIERVEVYSSSSSSAGDDTVIESYDGRALDMLKTLSRRGSIVHGATADANGRVMLVCPLYVCCADSYEGYRVRVTLVGAFARDALKGHWMKATMRKEPVFAGPLHFTASRKFSYSVATPCSASASAASFREREQEVHGCVSPVVVDVPLTDFASASPLSVQDAVVQVSRSGDAAPPALLSMRMHVGRIKGTRTDGVFASRVTPVDVYGIEEGGGNASGTLYFYPPEFVPYPYSPPNADAVVPFLRVKLAPIPPRDVDDDVVTVHVLARSNVVVLGRPAPPPSSSSSSCSVAAPGTTDMAAVDLVLSERRRRMMQHQQQQQEIAVANCAEDVVYDGLLRLLCFLACLVLGMWVLPALFEQAGRHLEDKFTTLVFSVPA